MLEWTRSCGLELPLYLYLCKFNRSRLSLALDIVSLVSAGTHLFYMVTKAKPSRLLAIKVSHTTPPLTNCWLQVTLSSTIHGTITPLISFCVRVR